MAIFKRTHLDQLEITRGAGYQVRFVLLLEEDGEEDRNSRKYHRTLLWNSGQVTEQMDRVNAHLISMKAAPVPLAQINRLRAMIQAIEAIIGWQDPPAPQSIAPPP